MAIKGTSYDINPEDLGLTQGELKKIFMENQLGSYIHEMGQCEFYLNYQGLVRLMDILDPCEKIRKKDKKMTYQEINETKNQVSEFFMEDIAWNFNN